MHSLQEVRGHWHLWLGSGKCSNVINKQQGWCSVLTLIERILTVLFDALESVNLYDIEINLFHDFDFDLWHM